MVKVLKNNKKDKKDNMMLPYQLVHILEIGLSICVLNKVWVYFSHASLET